VYYLLNTLYTGLRLPANKKYKYFRKIFCNRHYSPQSHPFSIVPGGGSACWAEVQKVEFPQESHFAMIGETFFIFFVKRKQFLGVYYCVGDQVRHFSYPAAGGC